MKKSHTKKIIKVTSIGLISNIILAVIKIVGGYFGKSQAVMADGIHSFSDLLTDLVILFGVKFWSEPPDEDHPYGHSRIETIISLTIGLILLVVATLILKDGIVDLKNTNFNQPVHEIGMVAFWVTMISIIVKEILFHYSLNIGQQVKSMAVIANSWHYRSDVLSSMPVVVTVIWAKFFPSWAFVDHVGAIIVSIFIFQSAFKIIAPSVSKLIDTGAPSEDLDKIYKLTRSIEEVKNIHDLRTRYIDASNLAIDFHISLDGNLTIFEGHNIANKVKAKLLRSKLSIRDIIIHIDPC